MVLIGEVEEQPAIQFEVSMWVRKGGDNESRKKAIKGFQPLCAWERRHVQLTEL
jgi:hypothetical protein